MFVDKERKGWLSHVNANDVQAISHANCWMYENTTRHDSSGLCEGKCICLQALYQKHCAMLPDSGTETTALILSFVLFASASQTQLCKEVNSMEFNEG